MTYEGLPNEHPSRRVAEFNDALQNESSKAELESFVTPERLSDWGDFTSARHFVMDQALSVSTRSLRHRGATDVAYVAGAR